MGTSPTEEAQAQAFLRRYYATCVSNPANLYTLYATDAAVCRDGEISHVPVTARSPLSLWLPGGASITVLNLTSAALDGALHITVAGAVVAPGGGPRGFSQSFVLAAVPGGPSIALDVFAFIDDAFYTSARPAVSFSVPAPPSQVAGGPIGAADKPPPAQHSEQPPDDRQAPPPRGQGRPAAGPTSKFSWIPGQEAEGDEAPQ
jgi:hypothetical protein